MALTMVIAAVVSVVGLISFPVAYYNYKESPPVNWFNKLIGIHDDKQWFSGFFSISSLTEYSSYSSQNYEVMRLWSWSLKLPQYWDTIATVLIIIWLYGYLINLWCVDLWNDLMEYPTFRNVVNCLILFILFSPTMRFFTRFRSNKNPCEDTINDREITTKCDHNEINVPDLELEDERESKCDNELTPLETVAAFVDRLTMEED